MSAELHAHVDKQKRHICTCIGRNGLITCAHEVITSAREKFPFFLQCTLGMEALNRHV